MSMGEYESPPVVSEAMRDACDKVAESINGKLTIKPSDYQDVFIAAVTRSDGSSVAITIDSCELIGRDLDHCFGVIGSRVRDSALFRDADSDIRTVFDCTPDEKSALLEFQAAALEAKQAQDHATAAAKRYRDAIEQLSRVMSRSA